MRLIDADALITWLSDWMFDKSPNPRMTEAERHDAEVMYETIEKAIRGIEKMPAIDAIPVIRCKDCKWQGDDEHCPVCNSCGRGSLPSGDWFCKDGERKES